MVVAVELASLRGILRATGHLALGSWLCAEDGVFELLGAACCLAAGVLFLLAALSGDFRAAVSLHSVRRRWLAMLLGLGLILCFLEETSWAQRIVEYQTPGWVAAHNASDEANLHNLAWFQPSFGLNYLQIAWLVAVFGGLVLLPLACLAPPIRRLVSATGIPVPRGQIVAVLAAGVFAGLMIRWWTAGIGPLSWQEETEVFEVLSQFVILLWALDACREPLAGRRMLAVLATCGTVLPVTALAAARAAPASWDEAISVGHRLQGEAWRDSGDRAAAMREYALAIERWPGNWIAQARMGEALRDAGNSEWAIQHFRQAIAIPGSLPALRQSLAAILASKGQLAEAKSELRENLRLAPDATAHAQLALLQWRQRELSAAEESARAAVRLAPNSVDWQYLLANILAQAGKRDEATKAFDAVLKLDPHHAGALRGRQSLQPPTAPK
jgi:Flp pilus assembly protein TadD